MTVGPLVCAFTRLQIPDDRVQSFLTIVPLV